MSSFARMPAPVMRAESLADIVHQAVFLHRNARAHITFATTLRDATLRISFLISNDARAPSDTGLNSRVSAARSSAARS